MNCCRESLREAVTRILARKSKRKFGQQSTTLPDVISNGSEKVAVLETAPRHPRDVFASSLATAIRGDAERAERRRPSVVGAASHLICVLARALPANIVRAHTRQVNEMEIETKSTTPADFSSSDHSQCPTCRKHTTRRSCRKNTFERILSLAYVYPFRCHSCGTRFFKLQWGVRYKKVFRSSQYRDNAEWRFQSPIGPTSRGTILTSVIHTSREERRQETQERLVA